MAQCIHDGHRERVRQEIMRNGFDEKTPPHKILEFLLFYCISRKDTNPIAHNLINRFGSISGVLDAPIEKLAEVEGMSERSALFLKSIMPVAQIYLSEKSNCSSTFMGLNEIGEYALKHYIGLTSERAGIISLDGKGKLLGFDFLADGDISSVGLSFRDVINCLLLHNAAAAVLVHNHPSGIALPSARDEILTKSLANVLKNIGIYLIDHIIIGGSDYVSMAQSKEYAHIFTAS